MSRGLNVCTHGHEPLDKVAVRCCQTELHATVSFRIHQVDLHPNQAPSHTSTNRGIETGPPNAASAPHQSKLAQEELSEPLTRTIKFQSSRDYPDHSLTRGLEEGCFRDNRIPHCPSMLKQNLASFDIHVGQGMVHDGLSLGIEEMEIRCVSIK